ncbi:MAG: secondary thiamine-phosphate synthase enzyme YjbQ [Acidimicrobiales bacterium]
MDTTTFAIETGHRQVIDITEQVQEFCSKHGNGDGLCSIFAPHATAGIALMEVGSGSEQDLVDSLTRVFPRDDIYKHRHGSKGHGADHLLPSIVSPSAVIPVVGGRLALGTWQSVVLVDLNADNPRRTIRLSFIDG